MSTSTCLNINKWLTNVNFLGFILTFPSLDDCKQKLFEVMLKYSQFILPKTPSKQSGSECIAVVLERKRPYGPFLMVWYSSAPLQSWQCLRTRRGMGKEDHLLLQLTHSVVIGLHVLVDAIVQNWGWKDNHLNCSCANISLRRLKKRFKACPFPGFHTHLHYVYFQTLMFSRCFNKY